MAAPAAADKTRPESSASDPTDTGGAPGPEDTGRASELLQTIASAKQAGQRQAALDELLALEPMPVSMLTKHLARTRNTTIEQRRAVFTAIEAEVPDEKGRFQTPKRATKLSEEAKDAFDWFAELNKLGQRPGLGEALEDVAVIRALARSRNPAGGTAILDFAFTDEGILYRDECGRYLRNMAPYSLPALIHGSQARKNADRQRYANYQLERLDRQDPYKAFAAADTEDLQIAVMKAFAESQYREAVYVVLDNVDHVAPRVRATTRAAWMEFATGRTPPKPLERQLELPGGGLSEEKEPLWLDHRQLADVAIRRRLEELTGQKPPKAATLKEMSEALLGYYDDKRQTDLIADLERGLELTRAGKAEDAATVFDRILVQAPEFPKRDAMVDTYLALAESYEAEKKWLEAAVAYGKANAVAPEGPKAQEALGKHHHARGKAAEAKGEDASKEFAMAKEIDDKRHGERDDRWLLFVGLAAIAAAAALLFLALVRRRTAAA